MRFWKDLGAWTLPILVGGMLACGGGSKNPPSVPAVPTGLVATAGDSVVHLAWNASSGASGYRVKQASSGGTFAVIASPGTATCTVASLTNGTTYRFVVSAVNEGGESGNSVEASCVPEEPATAPLTPSGLGVTVGSQSLTLSWTSVARATGYYVQRAEVGGAFTRVGLPTSATFMDTGLVNGTTYRYTVSAFNAYGESPVSPEATGTPVATFVRYLPTDQILKTDPTGSDSSETETCYQGWFDEVSHWNLDHLHTVESETGKKASMAMWYMDWSGSFPSSTCESLWSAGYVPNITWEPWTNGSMRSITHAMILGGQFDTYIDNFGKAIAAYGHPVFLRWGHEMNGNWYPWSSYVNGQTPQTYIAAYRYVHDRIVASGGTNAIWIWCPNNGGQDGNAGITASYPGDAYVDWTGVDFYNWGDTQSWSSWVSGANLLSIPYAEIRKVAPGKPMLIGEMGCTPSGGNKAAWISAFLGCLKTSYPNIRAFVWFNINKEMDWRFDATDADLAAFRSGVQDSYFLTSGANLATAHTRFKAR